MEVSELIQKLTAQDEPLILRGAEVRETFPDDECLQSLNPDAYIEASIEGDGNRAQLCLRPVYKLPWGFELV